MYGVHARYTDRKGDGAMTQAKYMETYAGKVHGDIRRI